MPQVADDKEGKILPNPAHFGWGCDRQCICEVFGQVPCTAIAQLPKTWRGKYIVNPDLLAEEEEAANQ